jgi:hypothetical protein
MGNYGAKSKLLARELFSSSRQFDLVFDAELALRHSDEVFEIYSSLTPEVP